MAFKKITCIGEVTEKPTSYIDGDAGYTVLKLSSNHNHLDEFYASEIKSQNYYIMFLGLFSNSIMKHLSVGSICQVTGVLRVKPKDLIDLDKVKYVVGEELRILNHEDIDVDCEIADSSDISEEIDIDQLYVP